MIIKVFKGLFFLLPFSSTLLGQKIKDEQLDQLSEKYARESFEELYDFYSIPSNAYYPEDIEKNIKWCEDAFIRRGFRTQRLATPAVPFLPTPSAPLLLAERHISDKAKTVLVYLQVDGQPVDSSKWDQESPWTPTLKEQDANGHWQAINWTALEGELNPDWRIFVRAASDAKGPDMMFLKAILDQK